MYVFKTVLWFRAQVLWWRGPKRGKQGQKKVARWVELLVYRPCWMKY